MATSECVVCMRISSLANDPAATQPATFSPAAYAVVSRVWLTTLFTEPGNTVVDSSNGMSKGAARQQVSKMRGERAR